RPAPGPDRKSTRLNSSHVKSSYAVFCLKKKREHTCPCRFRCSGTRGRVKGSPDPGQTVSMHCRGHHRCSTRKDRPPPTAYPDAVRDESRTKEANAGCTNLHCPRRDRSAGTS